MTSPNADWQRVREIFERVVDQGAADRTALLAELCAEDEDLRGRVEELLAADEAADGGFLDQPIVRRVPDVAPSSSPSTPGEIPNAIGPYEVQSELGRGGMGVVYLARDPTLERQVALKCLAPELAADVTAVERLEREARTLAALVHSNVATLYGFEQHDSSRYLVLEYVEGESLADRLARGPLSLVETLRLAAQVAAGLAAAHEKGIIHRDLKPANIRLMPDGGAKVLDFGLAKPVALPQEADALTHSGAVVGTVAYMSPEQASSQPVDRRGDVWAFGCVLWKCLSGQRPFRGETPWQTLDAIIRRPPDWNELPEDLPPRLERLLRRCLRKEPEERTRDLADVRLELLDLLNEVREGSTESFRPLTHEALRNLQRPQRQQSKGLAIAAFSGALGTVVLLAFMWWGGVIPPSPATPGDVIVEETTHLNLNLSETNLASEFSGLHSFTLTPDGQSIVYRGLNRLLQRSLTSQSHELLQRGETVSPFFSPDGEWIGFFFRPRDARTDIRYLFKMTPTGSHPVQISETPMVGVGASWGEDDTIVFAPAWQSALWQIDADGEHPATKLTELDAEKKEVSHRWPHVLPGSHAVVFTVKTAEILSFDDAYIKVFDRRTGDTKILVEGATAPAYLPTGHLLWGSGNALHAASFDLDRLELTGPPVQVVDDVRIYPVTGVGYFSVSRDGRLVYQEPVPVRGTRIVRLALDGSVETLIDSKHHQADIRLSSDGRYLVYRVIAANNSLWIFDRERGIRRRLSHDLGNVGSPVWGPNDEHVYFVTESGGGGQIVRLAVDGHSPPEVLWEDEQMGLCDTTADGGVLFQKISAETRADIWYLPATGEDARPLLQRRAAENCGRLSPDGKYLAYNLTDGGRTEVFLRSFPEPGINLQISTHGGRGPRWSRDGKEIYFQTDDGFQAMTLRPGPQPGPVRMIIEHHDGVRAFELDGDGFIGFDAVPDEPVPKSASLHFVLNWFDELQARMGEVQ